MEIYIIEYENERIAISNKYGTIEVECLRKIHGKPHYTNAKIFEIINKIGELDKNKFRAPDYGDVFPNSICEVYWFKKIPTKQTIEKICGKLQKTNKRIFNKICDNDVLYYVKVNNLKQNNNIIVVNKKIRNQYGHTVRLRRIYENYQPSQKTEKLSKLKGYQEVSEKEILGDCSIKQEKEFYDIYDDFFHTSIKDIESIEENIDNWLPGEGI